MTTSDYLTQLQQDRDDLVDNLTTQGIPGLTGDETFTELVPEVLNIQSGVDPSEIFDDLPSSNSLTNYVGAWFKSIKKFKIINNFSSSSANGLFRNFLGEEIEGLEKLNLSDTIAGLFMNCTNLKNVDLSVWGEKSYSNVSNLFMYCNNLETVSVNNLRTQSVRDFSQAFNGCNKLITINISNWDFSSCPCSASTNVDNMFNNCSNLENLTFGTNLGKGFTSSTNRGLTLSSCSKLTHDSLMSVINNLYDISSLGITVYLTLGATNLAKLSSAEIQIATDKGWTVN